MTETSATMSSNSSNSAVPLTVRPVTGVDCPACAKSIEDALLQLETVEGCEVNVATGRVRVHGSITAAEIDQELQQMGHGEGVPPNDGVIAYFRSRKELLPVALGAVFALPGLILEEIGTLHHPVIDGFSVVALLLAGSPVVRTVWRNLGSSWRIDIHVLMTLACGGAVILGAYTEAAMVMVLFGVGEALEGYTGDRARRAIASLMEVTPSKALRISDQGEHEVDVAELAIGDRVVVRPGERIPVDGNVVAGTSSVDEASISGESRWVAKEPGSAVLASTVNHDAVLEIVTERLAGDTMIDRMIRLVEEARERKAPAQRFIDRFATIYTPLVVVGAALTVLVPTLVFGLPLWNAEDGSFGWLYRGLALLVVACPCALVISTPVTLVSAMTRAARHGMLFKGGVFLETLSRVKTIAFDKTGTLTAGEPSVVAVQGAECSPEHESTECGECDELVALASAVEQRSEHPLANAIVEESNRRGLRDRYPAAEEVRALAGRGVSGDVDGEHVVLGSHRYFDSQIPHHDDVCRQVEATAADGMTPILVGKSGAYRGVIGVSDQPRTTTKEAIRLLRQTGIDRLVMLTGDEHAVGRAIGDQVGVGEVYAGLSPEDKVATVRELQRSGEPIVMVGDGINDAPALAAADVGIAMGGATGSGQAIESSDVTLMTEDLRQLPDSIRLSRVAMGTIRFNLAFSIFTKLVFVLLVLLGSATMWMAVVADVGTSLLVTLNGMRLLRWRPARLEVEGSAAIESGVS